MKIVKVDLEEGMHRRFKTWAFNSGFTMASALKHMIGDKVGHDERDAQLHKDLPGRARMNSEVTGKSERDLQMEEIPPAKVNPSISEVPTAKCRKCFDVFPVADMITEPKTGKLFCADCVENMKNGQ